MRVGIGHDTHRLGAGRALILGGVRIDNPLGLIGHSDADVVIHAVADALLGAAGLGDIGELYPDTDPQWEGLDGGALLATPEDSSEFEGYGSHGIGQWVTIFANPGHAYMDVAGLRLDTSAADDPSNQQGPRWRPLRRSNGGYVVRHPVGL